MSYSKKWPSNQYTKTSPSAPLLCNNKFIIRWCMEWGLFHSWPLLPPGRCGLESLSSPLCYRKQKKMMWQGRNQQRAMWQIPLGDELYTACHVHSWPGATYSLGRRIDIVSHVTTLQYVRMMAVCIYIYIYQSWAFGVCGSAVQFQKLLSGQNNAFLGQAY